MEWQEVIVRVSNDLFWFGFWWAVIRGMCSVVDTLGRR